MTGALTGIIGAAIGALAALVGQIVASNNALKQADMQGRYSLRREIHLSRREVHSSFLAAVSGHRYAAWTYVDTGRREGSVDQAQWERVQELWTSVMSTYNAVELEGAEEVRATAADLLAYVKQIQHGVHLVKLGAEQQPGEAFWAAYTDRDRQRALIRRFGDACRSTNHDLGS